MKLEDQVCSFVQAKDFERRHIFIDTEKVWVLYRRKDNPMLMTKEEFFKLPNHPYSGFIAPNVAELGDVFIRLGFGGSLPYKNKDNDNKWEMPDFLYEGDNLFTEAQARSDALIWLIDNDYIIPKGQKL
jgi:hypothetical protein